MDFNVPIVGCKRRVSARIVVQRVDPNFTAMKLANKDGEERMVTVPNVNRIHRV